jgi:hypothetical protein
MLKSVYKLYKTKRNEKGQESVGIYVVTIKAMTQIYKKTIMYKKRVLNTKSKDLEMKTILLK